MSNIKKFYGDVNGSILPCDEETSSYFTNCGGMSLKPTIVKICYTDFNWNGGKDSDLSMSLIVGYVSKLCVIVLDLLEDEKFKQTYKDTYIKELSNTVSNILSKMSVITFSEENYLEKLRSNTITYIHNELDKLLDLLFLQNKSENWLISTEDVNVDEFKEKYAKYICLGNLLQIAIHMANNPGKCEITVEL